MCVCPQYETFFVLLFWCLKFRGHLLVFFWKYIHPSLRKTPSIMHECVFISFSVLLWGSRFLWGLMCIDPCIVVIDEEENQLDATQYFIELVIGSTCFGHHYDHLQPPINPTPRPHLRVSWIRTLPCPGSHGRQ
jgi:hypothetical protein